MRTIVLVLALAAAASAARKPGSPLDTLPKTHQILTHFGERADFSPDNQRIAFMNKSFGDAFVIDLKTRIIRCLTCGVPGAAFLRVMHLADGNYILIGPERFSDIRTSRARDNELWYLSKEPNSKPVKLGQKMSEGAALSKKNLRMAWSETDAQFPELPRGYSRLVVADIAYAGGVMTVDLATGQVVDHSQAPEIYNEVEGIFPDGKYTLVESSKQVETLGGQHGSREIDIWKLRLDGTGKDFTRVTHFNDYQGWKASNPVVSTDGRWIAYQIARAADEAGVGYGLILMPAK